MKFSTCFWIEAFTAYPFISKQVLRVLISFATSYKCKAGVVKHLLLKNRLRKKNVRSCIKHYSDNLSAA